MFKLLDHPLITHKLTHMRKKETGTKDFRENLDEIAELMAYEVCRDLPVKPVEIETPVAPCTGYELSKEVAEVVKVIRDSGLPNKTYSMFTEIEGEWDEVMKVVKNATFVLAEKGIRTEVIMKMDIRPGYNNMMTEKIDRMENQMQK